MKWQHLAGFALIWQSEGRENEVTVKRKQIKSG